MFGIPRISMYSGIIVLNKSKISQGEISTCMLGCYACLGIRNV